MWCNQMLDRYLSLSTFQVDEQHVAFKRNRRSIVAWHAVQEQEGKAADHPYFRLFLYLRWEYHLVIIKAFFIVNILPAKNLPSTNNVNLGILISQICKQLSFPSSTLAWGTWKHTTQHHVWSIVAWQLLWQDGGGLDLLNSKFRQQVTQEQAPADLPISPFARWWQYVAASMLGTCLIIQKQ